jgi:hypothetical protein
MLVNRKNVERGVTTIYGLDHSHLGDRESACFSEHNRAKQGVIPTARELDSLGIPNQPQM